MATENPDTINTFTPEVTAPRRKTPMWMKIVFGLAAIVAVLIIVIAMQPSDFRVTRSATMSAVPEAVFAQVNDFHNWEAWSPWAKMDPQATSVFEGPSTGTGAVFRWSGNADVGEGSMTIVESRPSDVIRIKLDFVRPFAATSDVQFTFQPRGDKTAVTWSMAGKNNFFAKAVGLFMDCEKMVGEQFEQGLANIQSIVESGRQPVGLQAATFRPRQTRTC